VRTAAVGFLGFWVAFSSLPAFAEPAGPVSARSTEVKAQRVDRQPADRRSPPAAAGGVSLDEREGLSLDAKDLQAPYQAVEERDCE